MKVLVTGADGLLGGNLVRMLLEKDYEVRVLAYPGSQATTLDDLPIESIEGDLLDDGLNPFDLVSDCDGVFHCAAVTELRADPQLMWHVNLEGTRRLVDACTQASLKRFLFVGSASSFTPGTQENPSDETAPFPEQYRGLAYVESKHKAAELLRKRVREGKLDAVIVAPTFLLGPYDSRPSGGEMVRRFLVDQMRSAMPGGRSFAHAADVAQGALAAFERGKTGETYILGGQNLTYFEFFTRIAEVAGVAPPRRTLPRSAVLATAAVNSFLENVTGKPRPINRTVARFLLIEAYYSSAKAVRELDMPQTPTEQAIQDSIDALREYGHMD